jgi:hypothetical protein
MNKNIFVLSAVTLIIGILATTSHFNEINAQTTAEETTITLGSHTPVVGYLTQSGGLVPINSYVTFDSNSMNKLTILNNNPVLKKIDNQTLNKFIEKVGTESNFRFFQIESPPPSDCIDCFNYILTIGVPTAQGTLANTVAFDSTMSFPEEGDRELIQELIKLIDNL